MTYSLVKRNVLSQVAEKINVIHEPVMEVKRDAIVLNNKQTVPYGTCIWLPDTAPSPLVKSVQAKKKGKKIKGMNDPLLY